MSTPVRASCFDASALLKLYVDELGSDVLREYWNHESTRFTTSICFYETLNLLKVCYFYRGELSKRQYEEATLNICAWYQAVIESTPELNFLTPEVFFAVQQMSGKHNLDLSDAFQIHSVKEGFFSDAARESKTILVSADKKLVKAARSEGLRVWNLMNESMP